MTTQQLIENAMLDALGLLSDEEQREFERSFWSSSPAVQAHVRREQTRLSRIESLLPQIEPPADLRAAVIQAVREAMVAELARPAPSARERGPIPILSSLHVSPMWRAASLGFAAAAAVFGATTLFMWSKYEEVGSQIRNNAFNDELRVMARGHVSDMVFSEYKVNLAAVDPATAGLVTLHYNADGEAWLTVQDLATIEDGYELRLTDASGAVTDRTLLRFQSEGTMRTHEITMRLPAEADGMRLALVSTAGGGTPLFVSEPLRLA